MKYFYRYKTGSMRIPFTRRAAFASLEAFPILQLGLSIKLGLGSGYITVHLPCLILDIGYGTRAAQ